MEKENQNKCPINIFTFLSVDESYHRKHIIDFLSSWPNPNNLLKAVAEDMSNASVLNENCVSFVKSGTSSKIRKTWSASGAIFGNKCIMPKKIAHV
jgi:hypothetical protein